MFKPKESSQSEYEFVSIDELVPHHSTISWNRQHRFKDTDIFQEIFDEMVLQAMNQKMVSGRVLFTDSTHLKANPNKHKFTKEEVEVETREYFGGSRTSPRKASARSGNQQAS